LEDKEQTTITPDHQSLSITCRPSLWIACFTWTSNNGNWRDTDLALIEYKNSRAYLCSWIRWLRERNLDTSRL